MKKFPLALSVALCGTMSLFAGNGAGTAPFMDTIAFYFAFFFWLLAALICYGILLAVSRLAPLAPPKQKRFLFFIALAAMIFLLPAIPLSIIRYDLLGWALAAFVLPVPLFLASFYQFFIKGFNGGIAAAAIILQILGIIFSLCQSVMVLHGWS